MYAYQLGGVRMVFRGCMISGAFYYSVYRVSISINPLDFSNLFLLVGLLEVYHIDYKALFLGSP